MDTYLSSGPPPDSPHNAFLFLTRSLFFTPDGGSSTSDMEDLENAHSSAASGGFDDKDKKRQVVESSEIQITPSNARPSPSRRIAERLEVWGVESRGAISLFVFKIWSVSDRQA
jgi:hypothetical protein